MFMKVETMLTKIQLTNLYDYCKYFRFQAEKLTREAANSRSLDPELRAAIVHEQTSRAKGLKRLETALGAEIDAFTKGSETAWPERVESPNYSATVSEAKRRTSARKKPKNREACTDGRRNNANASSTKRKPGRPRKTDATE